MVELIWDGKYRETPQGRQKVGPVRIALPFQTIETVNESAQDRQRSLELFEAGYLAGENSHRPVFSTSGWYSTTVKPFLSCSAHSSSG